MHRIHHQQFYLGSFLSLQEKVVSVYYNMNTMQYLTNTIQKTSLHHQKYPQSKARRIMSFTKQRQCRNTQSNLLKYIDFMSLCLVYGMHAINKTTMTEMPPTFMLGMCILSFPEWIMHCYMQPNIVFFNFIFLQNQSMHVARSLQN